MIWPRDRIVRALRPTVEEAVRREVEAASAPAVQDIAQRADEAVRAVNAAAERGLATLDAAAGRALGSVEETALRTVGSLDAAAARAVQSVEAAAQRALASLRDAAADLAAPLAQQVQAIEQLQRAAAGQLAFSSGHAHLLQQLAREKAQWDPRLRPPVDLAQRVRSLVRQHAGLAPQAGDADTQEDLLAEVRFLAANSALVRPMLELCAGQRVLYAGQCYYNLWYLSRALRERGWKADLLNWDSNPASQIYYHGEDFRFVGQPDEAWQSLRFYVEALYGYDVFHFSNAHGITFGWALPPQVEPVLGPQGEIHLLKALGKKIVYTNNGCHDGVSQTAFAQWGPESVCAICRWRDEPGVCSDARNLEWGRFRNSVSDYQCLLGGNRVDYNDDPRVHESPWVYALDPEFWKPGLEIPERFRIERRSARTVVLYHAVGNKADRTDEGGVNIKSSHVYLPLVRKLREQGWDVEMVEPVDIPNRDVRYLQAQADIFLEMLTFGWFGANAREAMMLGKPVVCYIRPEWLDSLREELPEYADELPVVTATPDTVEQVLLELIADPQRRAEIGQRSRAFMLRWHASDAAAAHFDSVYRRLIAGDPLLRTASAPRKVVPLRVS
jgi:hypothetical protein